MTFEQFLESKAEFEKTLSGGRLLGLRLSREHRKELCSSLGVDDSALAMIDDGELGLCGVKVVVADVEEPEFYCLPL